MKRNCCVAVVTLLVLALASAAELTADQLERKLVEVDDQRAGFETNLSEVERQCRALLTEYTSPEEQARIYYAWAHVEGQSGHQHPIHEIELVTKALELPLDVQKRLQLYMYWGNALEMQNRGVVSEDLVRTRREIAVPYLRAIDECVDALHRVSDEPIPTPPPARGDGRPDKRALTARRNSENSKARRIETLTGFQSAFEVQTATLYGKMPFATGEIEMLATQYIKDEAARKQLLDSVRSAVQKREEAFQGLALSETPSDSSGSPRLERRSMVIFNITVAAVIAFGAGWWKLRKRRMKGS